MARKTGKSKTQDLTGEDRSLWSRVAETVKPLHSNRVTGFEELLNQTPPARQSSKGAVKRGLKDTSVSLAPFTVGQSITASNMEFRETVTPSRRENVPGLDRNTSERLRRGRMIIEARVDLHGLTRKEAHVRLRSFLKNAHRSGKRCVLVITGKGSSEEKTDDAFFMGAGRRGVLREEVPKWLAQPDLRPLILDYRAAQAKHGGAGALYILLKRTR
ncbi:Smr/MutS family protein [Sneathiella chinensis]|uniref:Smr protein/Muts2-like n=1 Tax=Sneathiella chinensis TaxID=349750 RepID=A0ABQ5TZU9_9PROT|nr:Smr/MutS family protein [Sneathiella chinensis]GLQ04925.1 smr protein/Muts2-like [Sneathiella chinensis]